MDDPPPRGPKDAMRGGLDESTVDEHLEKRVSPRSAQNAEQLRTRMQKGTERDRQTIGFRNARTACRSGSRPDDERPGGADLHDDLLCFRQPRPCRRPLWAAGVRQHLHPDHEPDHRCAREADRGARRRRRGAGVRLRASRRDARDSQHRQAPAMRSFRPRASTVVPTTSSTHLAETGHQRSIRRRLTRRQSAAITDKTKAVYSETIGNPDLLTLDIDGVAEVAHDAGVPLIIDNTLASPYPGQPDRAWRRHRGPLGDQVHRRSRHVDRRRVVDGGTFDWKASGKFPGFTEPDPSYHGLVYPTSSPPPISARTSPTSSSCAFRSCVTLGRAESIQCLLASAREYAQCSSACFNRVNTCNAVNCQERRDEILKSLKVQTRKIRMELALSQEASDTLLENAGNVLTLDVDKRFNKNLRDFEAGTPNPVGRTEMQPTEIEHAKEIIRREQAKVEQDYKKMLVEKGVKDNPELHHNWVSKVLMDQVDKRKEEHQLKYRQLVFEESPLFAVIEKPVRFENGDVPVWTDKQIGEAFAKLSKNAETTKATVKTSINNGVLEFKRDNGNALGQWLLQLVPGTKDRNDLLYYMGMKNQVEEVLKKDKSMCATATTMANRISSKQMQNMGVVFVGSMAGGALTKGASKAAVGVFHIGRALSGAEAAGLTGLSIGSTFLGDSFRQYNTSVAEVTSGVREASELEDKRSNVKWNLAFAPSLGAFWVGTWKKTL